MREEFDEVTGLAARVIIEDAGGQAAAAASSSAAARGAERGDALGERAPLPAAGGRQHAAWPTAPTCFAADIIAKIPREIDQDQGHHRRSAAGGRAVRGAQAQGAGGHHRDRRARWRWAGSSRACGRSSSAPTTRETKEYLIPRGKHISVHEGDRVKAGEALMDGSPNPHDYLAVLGDRELQRYLVNEVQEVYRLQGVTINDKHIEIIVRQMLRRVRIEEVGDTEFVVGELVDKFVFQEENDRVLAPGQAPGHRQAGAARHHQGVAVHRQLHLGGVLPGDHPGADRGGHLRQDRRSARAQGERHRGPAHPGRHRAQQLHAGRGADARAARP